MARVDTMGPLTARGVVIMVTMVTNIALLVAVIPIVMLVLKVIPTLANIAIVVRLMMVSINRCRCHVTLVGAAGRFYR